MTVDVKNIADDELRITFSSLMSVDGLSTVGNYVFYPASVQVKEVLIPTKLGSSISYVDLYVVGMENEQTYTLTIQNLKLSSGTSLGTKVVTFTTTITKPDRILSGLPEMYDVNVSSTLRHLLMGVGLSDEAIGGATRTLRVQ